jgi:BirA family biotin operon repressor/biotin-[acetyl-CoA-carboxylase] ligase
MADKVDMDRDAVIIERLRESVGQFVSGTELAQLLGISRAAVGKRILGLRQHGWDIEAVPNRGYRLMSEVDSLEPEAVTPLLNTGWAGRLYLALGEIPSTNQEALRMAAEGAPHGSLVVADCQSSGRGRLGRSWYSPPGVNLYFSLVLRPELAPAAAPPLTLAAAVGVAEGVRGFVGRPPVVMWPNDLLYGGRKFCGILVEMSSGTEQIQHVVVGVGINVNSVDFPADLESKATSLRLERGDLIRREVVLASVLNSLEHWFDRFGAEGCHPIVEAWQELADWFGRSVTVTTPDGGTTVGTAQGLNDDGTLRLELPNGQVETVVSGSVTIGDGNTH